MDAIERVDHAAIEAIATELESPLHQRNSAGEPARAVLRRMVGDLQRDVAALVQEREREPDVAKRIASLFIAASRSSFEEEYLTTIERADKCLDAIQTANLRLPELVDACRALAAFARNQMIAG